MGNNDTSSLTIRLAEPRDASHLLDMIRGLAEYERLLPKLTATIEDLQRWLLSPGSVAQTLIAEVDGQPVGYAVFFPTFSTFRGQPKMYLEDIFVKPQHRGAGVGEALMRRVAAAALQRGCYRLEWSVLDWNEPAIDFYRRLGASPEAKEWTIFGVSNGALADLAGRSV